MQKNANIFGWLSIILTAGAQLILAPLIKQRLGAPGLGVWHLVFQTYTYLQLIDFGWSNAIVKEIAGLNTEKNKEEMFILLSTAKRMLNFTGLLFSAAGGAAIFIVPKWIRIPDLLATDFVVALALFSSWGALRYRYALPLFALKGQNKIAAYNLIEMIQSVGRPLVGAVMVIANFGIIGITFGYTISEAFSRWIAHKVNKIKVIDAPFDHALFRRILRFGGATSFVSISTLVTFYSSSFIIGWKLGVSSIAVYQCSIALPFLFFRLAIIPFSNRLPSLVAIFNGTNRRGMVDHALKTHIYVTIVSALILLFICSINEVFVTIWVGKELFAGFEFSYIYMSFLLLSIIRHNGFILCQASDRLKPIAMAHLVEVPINILLSIYLTDIMGLKGIAWSFLISQMPVALISQFQFIIRD